MTIAGPALGLLHSRYSFAKERNGRLWVAFIGGFGRIAVDPKPGTPVLDLVHREGQPGLGRQARALWFGTDGRRWIATNTGLTEWVIDSNGVSRFREHSVQDKFPHEAFLSMAEDNAGNLWIGTRRSGLLRMGSSRFQTFGASEGLQLGRDQLLLEAQSGQVSVFDIGGSGVRFTARKTGDGLQLIYRLCRSRRLPRRTCTDGD